MIHNKYLVPALAMIISCITGFLYLGSKIYHLDEVSSLVIAQDYNSLFYKLWHFEGNMWLYYSLLHLWLTLGTGETFVRLLSVLFGLLTIIPFFLLTKKLLGEKTAILATLLLPFQMLFVKNMQFARGYSLQLFLVVLSTYLFVQLLSKRNALYFVCYVVVSALAVYTHIYSILVLGSHFVYILFLRDKKIIQWMIPAGILITMMIAPLLLSPAMKSGQINWIALPGAYSVAATFVMLTGDFIPVSVITLFVVIYFCSVNTRGFLLRKYLLLLIWIYVPFLFSLLFSYFVKPIYNLQYFTIILPPVVMLTAECLFALKKKYIFILVVALILLLYIVRLGFWYSQSTFRYMALPNQNAPWKEAVSYIEKNKNLDDGIIVFPTYTYIIYDYYSPVSAIPLEPLRLATGYSSPFNKYLLQSIPSSYKRVWYIYNKRTDPAGELKRKTVEDVLSHNYKESKKMQWYELEVTLYTK